MANYFLAALYLCTVGSITLYKCIIVPSVSECQEIIVDVKVYEREEVEGSDYCGRKSKHLKEFCNLLTPEPGSLERGIETAWQAARSNSRYGSSSRP